MRKRFGLKEAILGSFLASAGCAGEEAESANIEKPGEKQKIIEVQPDVQTEDTSEFGLPADEEVEKLYESGRVGDPEIQDLVEDDTEGDFDSDVESEVEQDVEETPEQAEQKFENFLLQEIMEISDGETLPGFDREAEIERVIPKVVRAYHDKMFGESYDVYMKKYFKYLLEDKEYREEVKEYVEKYCEKYGVPISVARGVIGVESGGNNSLVSNKDAHGIFQVKQDAADQLRRVKFNGEDWGGINIDDLEDNIRVGIGYLRYLNDVYTGNWGLALMAYNTGPGNFRASIATRLYRYQDRQFKDGNLDIKPKKWDVGGRMVKDKKTGKKKRVFVDEVKKNYPGGWPAFIQDNHLDMVSGCSKEGLGQCERGYGSYPFHAMALSETVRDIFESDKDDIKLEKITNKFN